MMLLITLATLFSAVHVCALENLALYKPTWQKHPWPNQTRDFGSENAVDGLYTDREIGGQCTINNDGHYTAEWRVDMGSVVSISYINIFYRTNNQNPGPYVNRMAGFSLYVSNTTLKEQGHLCYKDQSMGNPAVDQRINCSTFGRYVIYYNNRSVDNNPGYLSSYAYNELCEVEVYGCRWYDVTGGGCRDQCPTNCLNEDCDNNTRQCRSCLSGYQGGMCKEVCSPGSFGLNCIGICSQNCFFMRSCDHVMGTCYRGCKDGWTGPLCDHECQNGHYGRNCLSICNINCNVTSRCDKVSGTCIGGCKPGFVGVFCNKECQDGHYGRNCLGICNINCNVTNRCDKVSGTCIGGCKSGFVGVFCNKECQDGYYGRNCQSICNKNCNDTRRCDKVSGTCIGGCKPGFSGVFCNQECQDGYYGRNCLDICNTNCSLTSSCDKVSGKCIGGCKPGFFGEFCNRVCSNGSFGIDCSKQCSINCMETQKCNRFTGQCNNGCKPGFQGDTCNNLCDETYYGINCTEICGQNCVNFSCHHLTGKCKVYFEPLEDTDSSDLPTVIGGCAAVLIVLILIVGIIIFYKRTGWVNGVKRTTENANDSQNTLAFSNVYQNVDIGVEHNSTGIDSEMTQTLRETRKATKIRAIEASKDEDVDIDEKVHEENPYGDFYVNEEPLIDIEISLLGKIIEDKSRNENDGFKKEYATLLYGERCPCDIGKLPENIPKNRFKTTFPYDHSRVILAHRHADYINANFIDGIRRKKLYIAAQGPKQNTTADFWLMIWQEDIEQVVMLTNLMEGTKWKCVQYWPNVQTTMDAGSFTIHSIEEKQYAFFIVRKLKVTNKKLKTDSRTIVQYHYTAWPDHGTPEPLYLLLFHEQVVRSKTGSNNGPVLVHCSAGIGRTGTYIAIDVLFEEGKRHNKINIAEYVKKMRRNRMNMVQTYEQYKTIFLTLNEMFKEPLTVLSAPEFLHKSQVEMNHKPAHSSALKMEFQKLLAVRPQYTENDYIVTSQFHDSSVSIKPLDRYVLFLTSNVPKRGRFINAISVPSFTNQSAFIVTKFPAHGDAVDFLRLITDYESEVVVCLEPLCKIESSSKWMPTSTRSKTITPFTVQFQDEQTTEIKRSNIGISKEGIGDETWSVEIVEPMNSLTGNILKTVAQILSMVSFARNIETEGPIVIVSRDGAALCGVFFAVYNLIQQLTTDGEIDAFSVVRLLQTRRPELCSTMEEYQLIHQALLSFIKSQTAESIYYNQ